MLWDRCGAWFPSRSASQITVASLTPLCPPQYVSAMARCPALLVGLLLAASVPMIYFVTQFHVTISNNVIQPRDSQYWSTWHTYSNMFPSGLVWPYVVLSEPLVPITPSNMAAVVNTTNAFIADMALATGTQCAALYVATVWWRVVNGVVTWDLLTPHVWPCLQVSPALALWGPRGCRVRL